LKNSSDDSFVVSAQSMRDFHLLIDEDFAAVVVLE
jgi:hypothetical protein